MKLKRPVRYLYYDEGACVARLFGHVVPCVGSASDHILSDDDASTSGSGSNRRAALIAHVRLR